MGETALFRQNTTGLMTYPYRGTFNRILFKSPLIGWRMGMGAILGRSMLVLSTWGRKSHQSRHTMVSFTPMGDRIYLGAGWGLQCDWYQNLLADSHVTLQVWDERVTGRRAEVVIPALARRVTDEDEFRRISQRLFETGGDSFMKPWLASLGINYNHLDMVNKRDRVHQVALDLRPIEPGIKTDMSLFPAPLGTDLKWLWAAMAGAFSLGWIAGRRRR